MWQEIQKLLVSLLWPVIKDVIQKLLREFSEWVLTKIKEIIERRKKANSNIADAKADEATEKARTAETEEETRQHEAIAKVWREVAEMFRQENEELKSEIELLHRSSDVKLENAVSGLTFNQAIDESGEEFKVNGGHQLLHLDEHTPK